MKKRVCTMIMASMLAIAMTGCSILDANTAKAIDLMESVSKGEVEDSINTSLYHEAVIDFGIRLFQNSISEDGNENVLISPMSVLSALSMTANGANGETRIQMEETLGLSVDVLNAYMYRYMEGLTESENCKMHLANSIWFTEDDRFTVNEEFLQINADYYGADLYQAPFDQTTLKDINNWVKEETDGMIPEILDQIPQSAIMYLVNALAFEAKWRDAYTKEQVSDAAFTKENGEQQIVEMMYSEEAKYIEDEYVTGFLKYYKGMRYAFVALLPKEGYSVSDYVSQLTGEQIHELLSNRVSATVLAGIPKFEIAYDIEMKETLETMGIVNAWNEDVADFSKLGSSTGGNIFMNRVLHKTFISVAEQGTKAGAATVVEMTDKAMLDINNDVKTVYLNRPFVYMLIDCQTNVPFFVGTVMEVEQ